MSHEAMSNKVPVIVVASDACYPIEYFAEGELHGDGRLEILYPFADAEGGVSDPDDPFQIDILGYRMRDAESESPLMPIDPLLQIDGRLKEYRATWGSSSAKAEDQHVTADFFTEARGYSAEDRKAINNLTVGQTWIGNPSDHTVTRL